VVVVVVDQTLMDPQVDLVVVLVMVVIILHTVVEQELRAKAMLVALVIHKVVHLHSNTMLVAAVEQVQQVLMPPQVLQAMAALVFKAALQEPQLIMQVVAVAPHYS
jgi:hypothetical protein